MGEIHDFVAEHGRQAAKALTHPGSRRLVDIAADVLEEESQALGITYSGFCMTSLPHKRLEDTEIWERKAARFSLLIEPGRLRVNRELQLIGVPYGSRARLIMLYLQTRAIQNGSPEVELGGSLHEWMERMGIPAGGRSYDQVRDQANRISACRLTFFYEDGAREGFSKDAIVKNGIRLKIPNESTSRQGNLWEKRVSLSETFFRALKSHPVPIWEPALRSIASQSLTIDVYIWLAYRLRSLRDPTPVTWTALHGQFGTGYQLVRKFKARFIDALKMALAVYPDAKVSIDDKRGLILFPSRPPVGEKKILAVGGRVLELDGLPSRRPIQSLKIGVI